MGVWRAWMRHHLQNLSALRERAASSERDQRDRVSQRTGGIGDDSASRRRSVRAACHGGIPEAPGVQRDRGPGWSRRSCAGKRTNAIHLVVSDVVMPRMSGGALAKEVARVRPDTQFLFVSGYAGKTILDHKVVDLETNFLQKPYTLRQLSSKIRRALDTASPSSRPK